MDHADRMPIDIGYDVGSAADASAEQADPRVTVRADGSIVIDILAPQPCQQSTEDEIVVCAPLPADESSQAAAPAESPTAMEKLGEALRFKVGPLSVGSVVRSDGSVALGATMKF